MLTEFVKIYDRDLEKLKNEMEAFHKEKHMWITAGSVKNSAGNLCLHLVGNLNTYIGRNLGSTGYVRNREAEFNLKDVPRKELIEKVMQTKETISNVLKQLDDAALTRTYPEQVLGYEMNTGFFLLHLATHLSYHLGQINYIRRILE